MKTHSYAKVSCYYTDEFQPVLAKKSPLKKLLREDKSGEKLVKLKKETLALLNSDLKNDTLKKLSKSIDLVFSGEKHAKYSTKIDDVQKGLFAELKLVAKHV